MRVLVFQHGGYCPPGMFADHLAADGLRATVVEFDRGHAIPDLDGFDVLMVMGGAMDVWEEREHPWLVPEKIAIRKWVKDLGRPYIGICLGHQLLADALGGTVGRAAKPEIALLQINLNDFAYGHPLYSGFGASTLAVQWHAAEVTALPPGGTVLASTADCAISAFAVAPAAFGVQYHVEATDHSVSTWSDLPASAALLQRLHGPTAASSLRAAVSAAMPELRSNSRRLYDNFMQIARNHRTRELQTSLALHLGRD